MALIRIPLSLGGLGIGEVDALGHDFDGDTLVAVAVSPLAGLEAAIQQDLAALLEIFAEELGGSAPGNGVEKVSGSLAGLVGEVPLDGNTGVARGQRTDGP